jgi:hypothetical protein
MSSKKFLRDCSAVANVKIGYYINLGIIITASFIRVSSVCKRY